MNRLAELESTISAALDAVVLAAIKVRSQHRIIVDALEEIRNDCLYLSAGHASFAAYVESTGIARSTAYRWLRSAESPVPAIDAAKEPAKPTPKPVESPAPAPAVEPTPEPKRSTWDIEEPEPTAIVPRDRLAETRESVEAAISDIRAAGLSVKAIGEMEHGKYIPAAAVGADLRNAIETLTATSPVRCPKCDGAKCKACGNEGWTSASAADQIRSDMGLAKTSRRGR